MPHANLPSIRVAVKKIKYLLQYLSIVVNMRIVVDVDDELGKRFRKAIIEKLGTKKGALREAVEEAIRLWLKKQSS